MDTNNSKSSVFIRARSILNWSQLGRYILVGGVAYLIEMATLYCFSQIFGVEPILAVSVSFWVGLTSGFILQKFLAFRDKRKTRKILLSQIALYLGLVVWNYFFTLVTVEILVPSVSVFMARTLAIMLITLWNFLIYQRLFNSGQKTTKSTKKFHANLYKDPRFIKGYGIFASLVLFLTTLYWSYLGATVNLGNADHLVDPYFFDSKEIFAGTLFPSSHTFLIKWPVFFAIRLFNYSPWAFTLSTVVLVLITVSALAFIIYRLTKRTELWATLYLVLASVLLLIPTQPKPGSWLPVNFAMLTTRNIEYVLYLGVLALLAYRPYLKSWRTWVAASLLLILAVSDRLFLYISLVGAGLLVAALLLFKRWQQSKAALLWLGVSSAVALLSLILLWGLDALNIAQFSSSKSLTYQIINEPKQLVLAVIFAISAILTNFGANLVYDVFVAAHFMRTSFDRLFSTAMLPITVNLMLLITAIAATCASIRNALIKHTAYSVRTAYNFLLMLVSSSVVSLGLFSISDHYYPADARYVAVVLFSLFVGLSLYLAGRMLQPRQLISVGMLLSAVIILGLVTATQRYNQEVAAVATVNHRNTLVADALASRKVDHLVGDYWRVVPTKFSAKQNINITPLGDCTKPRQELSSAAWQSDLSQKQFAYLLSFDEKRTDFPQCEVDEVVENYGQPNASVVIEGDLEKPKEQLLFYDDGATKEKDPVEPTPPSTVTPITLNQVTKPKCQKTIMNVVAHQDDDLLFMSPDLPHAIAEKSCVRTVYLTSGDGGGDSFYWLGREQGSEAAYSAMLGTETSWVYRLVKLDTGQFVTIANPKDNSAVSLLYLHLPDGNLHGEGFESTRSESMSKLFADSLPAMSTVDSQSSYTKNDLISALSSLMKFYEPTEVKTQSSHVGQVFPDHSDHITAGRFAKAAYEQYAATNLSTISFYLGYPVRELPENVLSDDLAIKQQSFFAYGKYDAGVCKTLEECAATPTYDGYLKRQYLNPD